MYSQQSFSHNFVEFTLAALILVLLCACQIFYVDVESPSHHTLIVLKKMGGGVALLLGGSIFAFVLHKTFIS